MRHASIPRFFSASIIILGVFYGISPVTAPAVRRVMGATLNSPLTYTPAKEAAAAAGQFSPVIPRRFQPNNSVLAPGLGLPSIPPLLYNAPDYPADNNSNTLPSSTSVVLGDFNGDDIPDVVTTGSNDDIAISLGRGDGTFGPPVQYPAGMGVSGLAAADINLDGKLDLIVGNYEVNTFVTLLGNGDGSFQSPIITSLGVSVDAVAVADFNGDGKPDVAGISGNPYGNSYVDIFPGHGDGTFGEPNTYLLPNGFYQYLALSDVNNDGKTDVVTVTNPLGMQGVISVFLGNGDGTLQTPQPYTIGDDPVQPALADFNGDGHIDIAVPLIGGVVEILLNNGNGKFQNPTSYPTAMGPEVAVAGDFNGDGKLDLAVGGGYNTASILLGNGDGTFAPYTNFGTNGISYSMAAGDLNLDGKLDLVVLNLDSINSNLLNVLLGFGDGTFAARRDLSVATGPASVAVGDFNRDGKPDLAIATLGGGVSILLATGPGSFSPPMNFGAGELPDGIVTADFNHDGRLDLAVSVGGSNSAAILLGNGDGTFQNAVYYPTGSRPSSIASGDFNGDGNPDLAVTNSGDNTVSILLGNSNGTFQNQVPYATGDQPESVAVGDFNNDGKLDLAVPNACGQDGQCQSAGSVSILLGNGNGTFQKRNDFASWGMPYSVALADFNGDGNLDAVVANYAGANGGYSQAISIFYGNGTGGLGNRIDLLASEGGFPNAVTVGDFNRDGKPDIAVANNCQVDPQLGGCLALFPGSVSLFLNNGVATTTPFSGPYEYTSGFFPVGIAVGNFDAQGSQDVVTSNSEANSVSVLLNTRSLTVTLASSPNPSIQGQAVTFSATAVPSIAGEPVPAGTIIFSAGHRQVTAQLANGVAQFTTSKLPVGSFEVHAAYPGSQVYNRQAAVPLEQTVNP